MLADAMRGPNLANQKAISETGIYDLCDRIFARIRFDHIDKGLDDVVGFLFSRFTFATHV